MASRGRNTIRVDITGLRGISKALGGDVVYRDAMRRVIQSATSQGAKRIQSLVPERSGALSSAIRQRYFDVNGAAKPQMGSVGTGAGISPGGFRYGWALNYAKKIAGKNTTGYRYSADGHGNSSSRAGQSTLGWISKAIPTMKAVIRRSVAKETKAVEAKFAQIAGSLP
jgi:hypothetical protein